MLWRRNHPGLLPVGELDVGVREREQLLFFWLKQSLSFIEMINADFGDIEIWLQTVTASP